jgi:hypothetical protein
MPWKSKAQEKWGNSPSGHQALGDAGVAEWNSATKGEKLPAKMPPAGKYKSTMHEYDSARPKRPVVSRMSK